MRWIARAWRDKAGIASLEAALVLPVLLVMTLGVAEYGNILYSNHQITTGIKDAARFMARHHDPATVEAKARQLAVTGSVTGGEKRVPWWSEGDITISYSTLANPLDPDTGQRAYRGGDPITVVRVAASVSYDSILGLDFLTGRTGLTLTAFHEERVIGE